MRDNQTRKAVFPMTETERALNSGLLSRVRGRAWRDMILVILMMRETRSF